MPRDTTALVLASLWLSCWLVALFAARGADGAPLDEPLAMPPAEPCIDGAAWAELAEDTGYWSPEGYSEEQIALAMDDFLPQLERCVPPGRALSARITVRVEAACTGRVTRVSTVEDGGLEPGLLGCLERTLRYADLPAHDAPEGFAFDYRLRLMYLAPPKPSRG